MRVELQGRSIDLGAVRGSHHVASCVGALLAMVDADARNVTHLEIRSTDRHLINQARGHWRRKDPLLKVLHSALEDVGRRFDKVRDL